MFLHRIGKISMSAHGCGKRLLGSQPPYQDPHALGRGDIRSHTTIAADIKATRLLLVCTHPPPKPTHSHSRCKTVVLSRHHRLFFTWDRLDIYWHIKNPNYKFSYNCI